MFIIRMAVRDLRAAWSRLLFFFLCLAVGVGSIVTLRSAIESVRDAMARELRSMLGGDVAISVNRPWEPAARAAVEQRLARATVAARTETVEALTMVRSEDPSKGVARLAEVVGVGAAYPLYGRFELAGGEEYRFDLLRHGGALVRQDLLAQLGASVGDAVLIGDARFTIRGLIRREPGSLAGSLSFGSRVFVSDEDAGRAGVLATGSRASFRLLLRVPAAEADAIARDINRQLQGQFVRATSFRAAGDSTAEQFARAEDYLSLVGLAVAVLGGIGVWSVIRVFMQQKTRAIAILKCVGATSRGILATYLLQVTAMGVAGSALGVGLAAAALAWIEPMMGRVSGVELAYALSPSAVLQGSGIGLLVALLFSLVPLLDARHVRPAALLRPADALPRRGVDWPRVAAIAIVGTGLVGLAMWQAGSVRVGAILAAGFAALAAVLNLAGVAIVRALKPLERSAWIPLRYAARRIGRPGNQVRPILLAVGLGVFLVAGIRMVETAILAEFRLDDRPDTPDLFLVDVQQDQVAGLTSRLADPALGVEGRPLVIPVLRGRVVGVTGNGIPASGSEDVRRRGLGREFTITYRLSLERNERIVQGTFWPASPASAPEVSVEQSVLDHAALSLGDVVRFDVLGRTVDARITSVRSVNWVDARAGGFVFVFRPGPLDAAPRTYVVPVRGPANPEARGRLQRTVVDAYPNVSVVDVREVLAAVARVLGLVTTGVTVAGSLVLATGILILIGSIALSKFQRVYEAAVLRTVGATFAFLALLLVWEYALLGLVAGTIGAGGGLLLSWAVSRFVLHVAWHPLIGLASLAIGASTMTVTGVGLLSSLGVLRRKPLATLRAE